MVVSLLTGNLIRVLETEKEGVLGDSRISSCILTDSLLSQLTLFFLSCYLPIF